MKLNGLKPKPSYSSKKNSDNSEIPSVKSTAQ